MYTGSFIILKYLNGISDGLKFEYGITAIMSGMKKDFKYCEEIYYGFLIDLF